MNTIWTHVGRDRSLLGRPADLGSGSDAACERNAQQKRRNTILAIERFTTPAGSWLPNQATISPAGRRFLSSLRGKLHAVSAIRCDGYTAKVIDDAPNAMRISTQRATIARATLNRHATDAMTTIVGHGDTHAIATNDARSGRAKNRRVEVTIRHARTRL